MDRARGFDVNSLTREYARRIMTNELPVPKDDLGIRIVPLGDEDVVTAADFTKICLAADEDFKNSKEAN